MPSDDQLRRVGRVVVRGAVRLAGATLAFAVFMGAAFGYPVDLAHAIVWLLFASIALAGAGVAHVAVWRVAARVELGRGDRGAEDG